MTAYDNAVHKVVHMESNLRGRGLTRASVSSLSLASMSISDDGSKTSVGSSSLGWGSMASRRAYTDLQALVPAQEGLPRQISSSTGRTHTQNWGEF